jgi:hypothetical protein
MRSSTWLPMEELLEDGERISDSLCYKEDHKELD